MLFHAKEDSGLGTTGHQLAYILVVLSLPLDPGTRWFMQLALTTLMIRITLEQMLRGGQILSTTQGGWEDGRHAGSEVWFLEGIL